jgi:putative heme-binding domain-containing protein
MVDRFSSEQHYGDLLKIASSSVDRQQAADAMGVLMEKKQLGQVHSAIMKADEAERAIICDSLVNCGKRSADFVLGGIAKNKTVDSQLRTYAIQRLGEVRSGAGDMIWWIDQKEKLDPIIMPAIQAALHRAKWADVKKRANELFPMAASKDNRPLPSIADLVKKKGDVVNGKKVFAGVGTCAKCHIVNGQGIEVGPDQSEIGSKLTKPAMYESILFPSAGISHNYENWMVLKTDGTIITGIMLGETESEIQLKDEKGIQHVISMDDVDEKKKQRLSLMPADLHKEMTEQELVDLVEYLMTLKKPE